MRVVVEVSAGAYCVGGRAVWCGRLANFLRISSARSLICCGLMRVAVEVIAGACCVGGRAAHGAFESRE